MNPATAFGAYDFSLYCMLDDANHLCHYARRLHEEAPKISDEALRDKIESDAAYLRDASYHLKRESEFMLTHSIRILVDLESLSRNVPDYQCEILKVKETILADIDSLQYWFGNFTERISETLHLLENAFGKDDDCDKCLDFAASMEDISWNMKMDVNHIQEKFEVALSVYADIALVLINNNNEKLKENK